MEKLVNMQMPVQTAAPVKAEAKQTKKSESPKGFDKLLKQQKDASKQEDVKKADAEPKRETAEEVKEVKEVKEELQETAEQLAAQLAAQQAAVQNLIAEWEGADAQEILPVAVSEEAPVESVSGTSPLEAETPAVLELGEMPQTDKTEKVTETETPKILKEAQPKAAEVQQPENEESREEVPGIQNAEASRDSGGTVSDESRAAAGQVETRQEENTQAVGVQEEQSEEDTVYTVQTNRPAEHTETLRTFKETEEVTFKTTVEELPLQLGKALTAQKTSGSQVLTVELEPASLGKLTIRLEYEAGRAAVSVMASNPRTLELLNEKATEIASILKEHTGEETVIYTHQPEREPGQEGQSQSGHGGQEERQQRREEKKEQTDSFAQQLRLGLV